MKQIPSQCAGVECILREILELRLSGPACDGGEEEEELVYNMKTKNAFTPTISKYSSSQPNASHYCGAQLKRGDGYTDTKRREASVAERLACWPPAKTIRVQSPAGPLPESCRGRCHCSADFLGGLPFPPPFHSGAAPYSPHLTLIGSQDLAVKSRPRAAVAERLACSPPTRAKRVQSPVALLPDDFRMWKSYRTMRVFSGISRFPHTFIPAPLHTRINHPRRISRPRCYEPPKSLHSLTYSFSFYGSHGTYWKNADGCYKINAHWLKVCLIPEVSVASAQTDFQTQAVIIVIVIMVFVVFEMMVMGCSCGVVWKCLWLDYSPPIKAHRARFPAGSIPDFRMWESCQTMSLIDGSSQGSPVSPAHAFRRCSITLTSTTLFGSQDLDVKHRPNLFTHSIRREVKYTEVKRSLITRELKPHTQEVQPILNNLSKAPVKAKEEEEEGTLLELLEIFGSSGKMASLAKRHACGNSLTSRQPSHYTCTVTSNVPEALLKFYFRDILLPHANKA
ncbi:hypothetical protein PR048_027942 [Dryococelus australis]|uniref:Uncharacterized protein n=1 Tax=Dryococelus australis TaxID=614101 RepID=A0ABQ9GHW8_9NEOP|nr:hypothetical protein PR048_027942 [Dryococelus australis]